MVSVVKFNKDDDIYIKVKKTLGLTDEEVERKLMRNRHNHVKIEDVNKLKK